jgi:branched-chain amino acid transport system ATP-binding protein
MERSDQKYALQVSSVSKSFGGVKAVNQVELLVPIGERRALIGPNGAGKTTLFNVIAGELQLDDGSIKLFEKDITHASVQQRAKLGLGRTYQISQLFLELTVEENLYLAAVAKKNIHFNFFSPWAKNKTDRDWVRQVAEQVELEDYLNKKVSELSHGMQRQLEMGMAVAMEPRLIMLDEPAAGLSPSERGILTRLIKTLPKDITLIVIDHDMEIVLDVADRITVLNRGSVLAEGSPSEIRNNKIVQEVYLGSAYA